jgi:hypothetical protein
MAHRRRRVACEANVAATGVSKYTGTSLDGPNDRTQMMFSFLLNARP